MTRAATGSGKASARKEKADLSLNWKGRQAAERGGGRAQRPLVTGTKQELTREKGGKLSVEI